MNVDKKKEQILLHEGQATLKKYFEKVVALAKIHGQDEFVVNLDDVWALAYSRKDHCLRALRKDFIEEEDYVVEEVKSCDRGRQEEKYMLTLKCMEFLIARRVRPVFEIYRRVFHQATDNVRTEDEKVRMVKAIRQGSTLLPNTNNSTPYELRDHEHGWFCMHDYGSKEFFTMFASLVIHERLALSGAETRKFDEEILMGNLVLCQRLLLSIRDAFATPGTGMSGDIVVALKHIGYFRAWLESYHENGVRRSSPMAYQPSRSNLAKSLIFPYTDFTKDFGPVYSVFSDM